MGGNGILHICGISHCCRNYLNNKSKFFSVFSFIFLHTLPVWTWLPYIGVKWNKYKYIREYFKKIYLISVKKKQKIKHEGNWSYLSDSSLSCSVFSPSQIPLCARLPVEMWVPSFQISISCFELHHPVSCLLVSAAWVRLQEASAFLDAWLRFPDGCRVWSLCPGPLPSRPQLGKIWIWYRSRFHSANLVTITVSSILLVAWMAFTMCRPA